MLFDMPGVNGRFIEAEGIVLIAGSVYSFDSFYSFDKIDNLSEKVLQ